MLYLPKEKVSGNAAIAHEWGVAANTKASPFR